LQSEGWLGRRRGQANTSGLLSLPKEPLAKLSKDPSCHSERSEESCIFRRLRSYTPFRMTKINSFARGSKVLPLREG
jgi:hypothetical protein